MIENHVVMPVRGQIELTKAITSQLESEQSMTRCWIYDNGFLEDSETWNLLVSLRMRDERFVYIPASKDSIYEMWNRGLQSARAVGGDEVNVAFLNNDLILAKDTIHHLSAALRSESDIGLVYPNYNRRMSDSGDPSELSFTEGTYRDGGMGGFCFMLRAEAVTWSPLVDSQFEWWGGDDDIAHNLRVNRWRQARLVGVPVHHYGEATVQRYGFHDLKARDLEKLKQKWGH